MPIVIQIKLKIELTFALISCYLFRFAMELKTAQMVQTRPLWGVKLKLAMVSNVKTGTVSQTS